MLKLRFPLTRTPIGALGHVKARRAVAALVLMGLLLGLWFGFLEYRNLFAPDEGRYAEIPREMLASGDWITPRLNGLKYFEKPALQYWATAAFYKVFGQDEWTARLWPALCGLLGLLTALVAGIRLYGRRTGLLAALMLSSMFGYILFSQIATLDMGLTLFVNVSLFSFLLSQREALSATRRYGWLMTAWAAMGLAILSKGLIGIVLPGLALVAYCIVQRDRAVLRRLAPVRGMAILLLIAAPWFIAVQRANPEFFEFFFVHEHLTRFVSTEHHRAGPIFYYLPVLIAGTLPWTPLLAAGVVRAWSSAPTAGTGIHVDRFLLIWCLATLLFFSVSGSKLPGYILPILPALALLGARHMQPMVARHLKSVLNLTACLAVVLAGVAVFYPKIRPLVRFSDELERYAPWMVAAAATMMLGIMVADSSLRDRRRLTAIAALAICLLASYEFLIAGAQAFERRFSAEYLVRLARDRIGQFDPGAAFYSIESYDQTLPVVLGRTVTLVKYRDELELGLQAEPAKGIPELAQFRAAWRGSEHAYAMMSAARYQAEQLEGLPMTLLVRDQDRVIVSRAKAR